MYCTEITLWLATDGLIRVQKIQLGGGVWGGSPLKRIKTIEHSLLDNLATILPTNQVQTWEAVEAHPTMYI